MTKKSTLPKKSKTRQVVKTGDVVAIPLPNGRFAFGLQFDGDTAIYSATSDRADTPPIGHRQFLFAVGVYRDVLSDLRWPKVGKDPVSQEEIEFVGLGCLYHGEDDCELYSAFFDGYTRPATQAQCFGLEPAAAWDDHHIIDRVVCSLKGKKTEWLDSDPWVPFALDMSDPKHLKRVPLAEIPKIYAGRTKDMNLYHHKDGFGPAKIDRISFSEDAIRGREQQLIEKHRKEGTAADQINGIAPDNPKRQQYLDAADKAFGVAKQ